ncbi:unnamed protein product, partial [Polarella glacialis]
VGPIVPVSAAMRRRSVTLNNDPRMQEMKNFVGSHAHDDRLLAAADLRKGLRDKLPKDWRDEVEVLRQAEAFEDNCPMPIGSTDNIDARLQWREGMDRNMRRLIQDTQFAYAKDLPEAAQHELRCGHVDKMHEWYEKHGMKQARKEREAPAHIRYNEQDKPLPGSTRTHLSLPSSSQARCMSQTSGPSSGSNNSSRCSSPVGKEGATAAVRPGSGKGRNKSSGPLSSAGRHTLQSVGEKRGNLLHLPPREHAPSSPGRSGSPASGEDGLPKTGRWFA